MSYHVKAGRDVLERWSAAAFVAAGVLYLATSALFGSETITDLSHPAWVTGVLGLAALFASFIGLAGLYPQLAARVPRLARAGLLTVAVAGLGSVAFPLCLLAKTSGTVLQPLPIIMFLITIAGTMGGFLLFGIASLRTRVPSRTVGLLIVATATTFVVLFAADMVYGGSPEWVDFVMSGIQAVLLLTVGYVLPTSLIPIGSAESQTTAMSG